MQMSKWKLKTQNLVNQQGSNLKSKTETVNLFFNVEKIGACQYKLQALSIPNQMSMNTKAKI